MLRIGITEQGDAGLDYGWMEELRNGTCRHAVLITKRLSEPFIDHVIQMIQEGYGIIVHATVTGWGGTVLEPNVPRFQESLRLMGHLLEKEFPFENLVLRIDPVFPTENGLKRLCDIIENAHRFGILQKDGKTLRVRMSVLDEYPHVKERFQALGFSPIYGKWFYPDNEKLTKTAETLQTLSGRYHICFEACAEDKLAALLP